MEPSLSLQSHLEQLWQSQKPFVVFGLPESEEVQLYFQEDHTLHTTKTLNE